MLSHLIGKLRWHAPSIPHLHLSKDADRGHGGGERGKVWRCPSPYESVLRWTSTQWRVPACGFPVRAPSIYPFAFWAFMSRPSLSLRPFLYSLAINSSLRKLFQVGVVATTTLYLIYISIVGHVHMMAKLFLHQSDLLFHLSIYHQEPRLFNICKQL